MTPSSDQVAQAFVAACIETGENPEHIARREMKLLARHYALHALARVFPLAPKEWLSQAVGCEGDGRKFWNNSVQQKFKMFVGGPRAGKRIAQWWDETAFEQVIAAINVPVEKATAPIGEGYGVYRDEPQAPDKPPVKLSAKVGSIVEPSRPAAAPGKRKLNDMLRAAVENTQRMTPPPENQP